MTTKPGVLSEEEFDTRLGQAAYGVPMGRYDAVNSLGTHDSQLRRQLAEAEKLAALRAETIGHIAAERDAAVRERDEARGLLRSTAEINAHCTQGMVDLRAQLDRAIEALRSIASPDGPTDAQELWRIAMDFLAAHDKDESTSGDRGSAPTAQASAHETEAPLVEQSKPGAAVRRCLACGERKLPGITHMCSMMEPAPPKTEAPGAITVPAQQWDELIDLRDELVAALRKTTAEADRLSRAAQERVAPGFPTYASARVQTSMALLARFGAEKEGAK